MTARVREPLIDDAWGDLPTEDLPGILIAYPSAMKLDLDRALDGIRCPVFADSGAYSANTVGLEIDLKAYGDWLERFGHHFTAYANLDVIGDHVATAENQARLEDRGLHPLPAFHPHEPWDVLDEMAARYDYLALGGIARSMQAFAGARYSAARRWLVASWKRAKGARLHGFGITRWEMLWNLPWHSTDSTTWINGMKWGELPLFSKGRHVSVPRQRLHEHIPALRAAGYTFEAAMQSTIPGAGQYHHALVIGLRHIALAQAALRARHRTKMVIYAGGLDLVADLKRRAAA